MKATPVAIRPWANLRATAAICAVVALWVPGLAVAQVTPARQETAPQRTSAPAPARARQSVTSPAMAPAPQANQATALVNQIEMLKQQNRQLLGQVEQLQHELQQLKEINKEQYIALDTRLKRLEGASAPAATGSAGAPQATASVPASTPPPTSAAQGRGATVAESVAAPAQAGSTATADSGAQTAYDAAFNALRAGNFVTSARSFRAFIQTYPHDKLTPNAWYWLGESYYVTQNYQQALQAFEQVVQRFPDSRKAPGAMLKKGYSEYSLKQTDKAVATLQSVVTKYPGSSVANLAKQRLQDIRLQQQMH